MGLDFKAPCKYTLSANEIRVFSECPRKRYYSSRDCLAIRANTPRKALIMGSAFHQALQYYYEETQKALPNNIELTIDNVQEVFDSVPEFPLYREIVDENGLVSCESIVDSSEVKTLSNIIECYKPQIVKDIVEYEIIGCETNFALTNWPIEDVMYHGIIDMTVRRRSDGKYYYFEHKTCANFRPEIYSRFDIQLHICAINGYEQYGSNFGGMILNQVKKAKTPKGYDQQRDLYEYTLDEMCDFYDWISAKTEALVSPSNLHAPCNNYMSCKMCEYIDICMRYGYKVPKSYKEITECNAFTNEEGEALYAYDPRDSKEEEE